MSITLIEGLILLTVAGVGGIVWWGVMRLVSTNDQTLAALNGINSHLATINGRLGNVDLWTSMHQTQDDREFAHININLERIWKKLEPSGG